MGRTRHTMNIYLLDYYSKRIVIQDGKRRQDRQKTRWRCQLGIFAEVTWNRQTADRYDWRRLGEGLCFAVDS